MSDNALAASATRTLLARRVFSLSGVIPLGVFLAIHLVTNSSAVWSDATFVRYIRGLERLPALPLVEALFIFAPLVFHAAVGLWLTMARKPLAQPSPYPPAVGIAMRATGVITLAFLAMHLREVRFRTLGMRPSGGEMVTVLASDLSSTSHGVPWRGIVYLVAVGCVTFHFAAGSWGFLATYRPGEDLRAARMRRRYAWCALAMGTILWMGFANVVVLHATGAPLMGTRARFQAAEQALPCPVESSSVPVPTRVREK